jgi:hypothetical protein
MPGSASQHYRSAGTHCFVVEDPDEDMWASAAATSAGPAATGVLVPVLAGALVCH